MSKKGNIVCHEIDERFANTGNIDFYTPICYFKMDSNDGNTEDYFSYPKMFATTNTMLLKDFYLRIYAYLRRYLTLPAEINKLLNNSYEEFVENYAKSGVLDIIEYENIIKSEYNLLFENKENSDIVKEFVNNFPYEIYIHQISTEKDKTVKEEKILIFNGKSNEKFADSNKIDDLINSIKKGNRLIINFKKANLSSQDKLVNINECIELTAQNEEKDPSLRDCLQFFSLTEKFDRFNEWYCVSCKKSQQAYKKTEIFYSPKYLIINLKRFEYIVGNKASNKNNKTAIFNKIDTNVSYPVKELNLSDITHNQYSTNDLYELYGVVQHYGSQSGGHYTSICNNNGTWYEFNDNSVFKIEDEYVNSNSAYMLFYRKKT